MVFCFVFGRNEFLCRLKISRVYTHKWAINSNWILFKSKSCWNTSVTFRFYRIPTITDRFAERNEKFLCMTLGKKLSIFVERMAILTCLTISTGINHSISKHRILLLIAFNVDKVLFNIDEDWIRNYFWVTLASLFSYLNNF